MSAGTRVTATLVQALLVALWLGAALLFATVVARAAFAVLPTRTLAGELVGRVLPVVFWSGAAVTLVAALLEARSGIAGSSTTIALGVATGACLVAQLLIGARIAAVRARIGGPIDALASTDPLRVSFGRLHAYSVGFLGIAMIAAAVALVLSARAVHAAQAVPTLPRSAP